MLYKDYLKKSAYLTYILVKTDPQDIKNVLLVFVKFMGDVPRLKEKYTNQYHRISDMDTIGSEIIQTFIIKLIVNMRLKFAVRDARLRRECLLAARLLAAISSTYLDKNKIQYKQFASTFTEIVLWYNKQKDIPNAFVEKEEIRDIIDIYNKFKKSALEPKDQIHINAAADALPAELQKTIDEIDMMDTNEFKDGIDTEIQSYKYFNALQQYKVLFNVSKFHFHFNTFSYRTKSDSKLR